MTEQTNNNLVDFWSYSSMSQLLRNPLAFKKKYVLKIYDDLTSPTAVVGKAAHKALESYFNGMEREAAIEVGLNEISLQSDAGIRYGKTGSREKMLKDYTQAINFYFEEMPTFHEILGVELGIVEEISTPQGEVLSLPAKSYSDLVVRNKKGEIEVWDHKFVAYYSDPDTDNFSHFLQGMFNYHTIKAKFGEAPARIIFNECKVAKNKDGSPQIKPYTIEFGGPGFASDLATFYKLYNACTKLINLPDMVFLPNPADIFDGQNAFESFRIGVIGVDRPVSVKHRTEEKAFVEKQFVGSKADSAENVDLTTEERIRLKLQEFGIPVEMRETHVGSNITQYTLKPSRGRKMSEFKKLADDIAIAIKAESIRIEAPIRGTDLVGIEVPSLVRKRIDLTDEHLIPHTLNIPIGVNVHGALVHKDLSDMPHLLVAGATGSGKSVMLNVILTALTRQMKPDNLKLVLIDPKRVELSQFKNVPHLMMPVIYDDEPAQEVLEQMVIEMEERYKKLETAGVRSIDDIAGMAKIVIVIDEFADLMLNSMDGITERHIIRLAQKARAVGIHLVLATQRPSADVVTGLIKANIPTKIAFMTTSAVNSRVILDENGAEELTGKGDMLFLDPSKTTLQRLQGLYI